MAKKPVATPWTARQRSTASLGIAALATAAGVMLLYNVFQVYEKATAEHRKPPSTQLVVHAARDLTPGVPIAEEDLFLLEMPAAAVPKEAVRYPEAVIGRMAKEKVYANEVMRTERMANPEDGSGLNAIIPTHLRALSVELVDGAALGGHLEPGSYVDLITTFHAEEDASTPITVTMAQELFVLAVNDRPIDVTPQEARDRRGPFRPSVTLLVSPEEAERVVHAYAVGTVRLALRNDLDHRTVMSRGVDAAELLRRLNAPELPIAALETP